MATGDIGATLDTQSIDTNAYEPFVAKHPNADILITVQKGSVSQIQTWTVDSTTGAIGAAAIDSLAYGGADYPEIRHVSDDLFILGYPGGVATFECDSAGNLSAAFIDTLATGVSSYMDGLKLVSGNIWAHMGQGGSNYTYVKTFSVTSAGVLSAVIDSWNNTQTGNKVAGFLNLGDGVFAIAASVVNTSTRIDTISIDSGGNITSVDSWTTVGSCWAGPCRMITVSDTVRALVYPGNNFRVNLVTLSIAANGAISKSIIDSATVGASGWDCWGIGRCGPNQFIFSHYNSSNRAFFSTWTIQDDGTITGQIDTYQYTSSQAYTPQCVYVGGNVWITSYRLSDNHGYIETIGVTSVGPPTLVSITPEEGKVGRTYDIVVSGTNFADPTTMDFGSGITVDGVAVISASTINVTITIDGDAAQGYRDVTVDNGVDTDTLTNGFYVITTEDHYSVQISGLRIPYIDEDGGKQLHVVLENLSPTTKSEGEDGEVVIDIGYEVAG